MNHLPDNTGYVAAAYLVFVAMLLVYFAIMAIKTARLERDLQELNQLAEQRPAGSDGPANGDVAPEPAGVDA